MEPAFFEIYIPENIQNIENGAFSELGELTWIEAGGTGEYTARDGILFSGTELAAFPAGRTGIFEMPKDVTSIRASAFANTNLDKIDMRNCISICVMKEYSETGQAARSWRGRMEYKQILNIAVLAGEIMLRSGAETYRVEDTMKHILNTARTEVAEAFVMMTGIVATLDNPDMEMLTAMRRVHDRGTNMIVLCR